VSGARHNCAVFKPEPPVSDAVYVIVTGLPTVVEAGNALNALIVGGVVSKGEDDHCPKSLP